MSRKHYKSMKDQLVDYYNTDSPFFDPSHDDTKYNPTGINEDKNYLNSDGVVILDFDFKDKTSAINYNLTDIHVGSPESKFKTAKFNVDFIVNVVSKYVEYAINIINLNDLTNNGNVRADRDSHHQAMSVDQAVNQVNYLIKDFKTFIKANVQANHENWIDDLIGTNPVLWYSIPRILYSRGVAFLHLHFKNYTYKILAIHKYNANAERLAKQYGADALFAGHTHKPRVCSMDYEFYNPATNTLERKKLNVLVGSSSLPTSSYATKLGMSPASTSGYVQELLETKDGFLSNMLSILGIISRFSSVKVKQGNKLLEELKKVGGFVNLTIDTIMNLPLPEAIYLTKLLSLELNKTKNNLIIEYEKQREKEKKQIEKTRKKFTSKGEIAKNVSQKAKGKTNNQDELVK